MTENIKEFISSFDTILIELMEFVDSYNLPEDARIWLSTLFKETIPGGKMNRGLTVTFAASSILKRLLTEEEKFHTHILGWCVEMVL
jgi:farnesyl diphosphate synthase